MTTPGAYARRRLLVVALTAIGFVVALAAQQSNRAVNQFAAADTWAYWSVNPSDPNYGLSGTGIFLYSPAAAQVMSLLGLLPWEFVRDGWGVVQVILLTALAGPFTAPLALTRPVQWELILGNISLVLAAVSVAGLRWPALWSIGILTKVTPGIGLLWFASRHEWRALAIGIGVTVCIAVASFVVAPGAWLAWVGTLLANGSVAPEPEFWVPPWSLRLLFAAGLIWFGARRDWRWVVPIAVMLASPHLWAYTLTIAVGSLWYVWTPALRRHDHGRVLSREVVPAAVVQGEHEPGRVVVGPRTVEGR